MSGEGTGREMVKDAAYREAERKIEEARRTGATSLNLSNMRLTELPRDIGQLTALQSLQSGSVP